MFIRPVHQKTTANVAIQIVEIYRVGDKVRQCILRHMDSAPKGVALEQLRREAELEMQRLKENHNHTLFPSPPLGDGIVRARQEPSPHPPMPIADALSQQEVKRLSVGIHEAFGTMCRQLGLEKVWPVRQAASGEVFRQAVLMCLAAPGASKCEGARLLGLDHGVDIRVDRFYRMVDHVDERRITRLKQCVEREVRGLLEESLEVLFFDISPLYFASEQSDDLRRKGWSKDHQPEKVQVVLALVQTREELPVDYQLFPGNTTDVTTLIPMLKELKQLFVLKRAVVVTDADMTSRENLTALSDAGFDWVVAARLRQLSRTQQAQLGSCDWDTSDSDKKRLANLDIERRRLVLQWDPKRARKDQRGRDREVKKLRTRLNQGFKGRGRHMRYLKVEKGAVSLDQEAIERDALLDGLHGVWTSLTESQMSAPGIRQHYAQLWQIEQGFRVLKHTLAVRPIYHWTEPRVRAHVAICYVAFALLRILRFRYRSRNPEARLSEEQLLDELRRVETSVIHDPTGDQYYALSSQATQIQKQLYTAVGCQLVRGAVPLTSECARHV